MIPHSEFRIPHWGVHSPNLYGASSMKAWKILQ